MNKSKNILSLSFVTMLTMIVGTNEASSADIEGDFAVRGVGGLACSDTISLLQEQDEPKRQQTVLSFVNWTAGYLSYVNRSTDGVFDVSPIVDGSDLLQLIVNQCGLNEDQLFESVAFDVFSALAQAAVVKSSELVSVEGENQSAKYRKETIVAVQASLVEKGFLEGPPDGVVGPETVGATTRFQESEGLPATGFLDLATVIRVLIQ